MSCTIYSVPSCNVVRKQDVQVRQLVHTVGQNTVYQFEWFWQNAQCTSQNRLGKSVHRVLSQNVHPSWTDLISWPQHTVHDSVGGCGTWLCGACHSSLFIYQ